MEKALLLQRTLLTGRKEPNVAANELATKPWTRQSRRTGTGDPEPEDRARTAPRTRRPTSPMTLIQRYSTRAAGSRGIYQGDPTRDRVQEIQKPRSTQ